MKLSDAAAAAARFSLSLFGQQAFWFQRIRPTTPDAYQGANFDPLRAVNTTLSDETFGVGWRTPDYAGYIPRMIFACGIRDEPTSQVLGAEGIILYEEPTLYAAAAPALALVKGDVIILTSSLVRYVIKDSMIPVRLFAQTYAWRAPLEKRQPHDPIYAIPYP